MEKRWDAAAVIAVRALPRKPVPQREDISPQTRMASRDELERQGPILDGSKLERPQVINEDKVPRELRIWRSSDTQKIWRDACTDSWNWMATDHTAAHAGNASTVQ